MIEKWEEWGAALAFALGPLGMVISLVKSFISHWQNIKNSFKEGGILGGIKAIGVTILDAMISPMQHFLEMVAKIPGMKSIASGAAGKIAKMRSNLLASTASGGKSSAQAAAKAYQKQDVAVNGEDAVIQTSPGQLSSSAASTELSGSGSSSSGKSITMTLDIKNYFNVDSSLNIEDIAEQVVGKINDKLRDATIALN